MLHQRCTGDARWVAGRALRDRSGTGICIPGAGPVVVHASAVSCGRSARPSAADARTPDSELSYVNMSKCDRRLGEHYL